MSTRKPAGPAATPKPHAKPAKPSSLEAVVQLLLGLEDTLTGSSPEPERIKGLYDRLKEVAP